ncbi:hypothetical protein [Adhaeribacter radiodurans]|uniref:DUF3575 domain-containing protein n=1 Tax=Adhaeribacter radiodurans TaxID=2745197 RepID=A0A7L7L5N8_9BACT|nr:hypothetical protein [Adhaeribacter radiodurans]QMU28132.1 hypothetical protein HUW48_08780 [Adhaeribacter radiodurans]
MKKLLLFLAILLFNTLAQAQPSSRVAYSLHLDWQGFSVPLAKPKTYGQNRGLSFGLTYNWNKPGSLQQTVKIGNFFNKYHGSSWHASTVTHFNPIHSKNIRTGFYAGFGYMITGSNQGGWQQQPSGEWTPSANNKGLLFIPVGLQVQLKAFENNQFVWSPTIAYQANALFNYTPKTLVLPQSFISVGSQLKFK